MCNPVEHITDAGGFAEFFGTQLPLLWVNPDAHEISDWGGRQFPNPSVWYPDGQLGGFGFVTTTGTQLPFLSG